MSHKYYRITHHFRNTDVCFRTAKEASDYVEAMAKNYWHCFHRNHPWGYRTVVKKQKGA